MKDLRTIIRENWSGIGTLQEISVGAQQRMADAMEKMAIPNTELMRERDDYERMWKETRVTNERMWRRLSAARGQITKLKKALAAAKGDQQ